MEKPELVEDLGRLYPTSTSKQKTRFGVYKCPYCGKLFRAQAQSIKSGNGTSCGCYQKEKSVERFLKHGLTHSAFYVLWQRIKRRCYNPNSIEYKDYGARGITVCDEWINDFIAFKDWAIANGYQKSLQIDRRNNDKGYSPDNCRFVDRFVNKQNGRLIQINNTSGYRGTVYYKKNSQWVSKIQWAGKRYYLGAFAAKEDAAYTYNQFVIEHNTAHPLNILPDGYISKQVRQKEVA